MLKYIPEDPSTISLTLDCKKIKKPTEEDRQLVPLRCPNLTKLCANGCMLVDLNNFPILPNLEVLELQDNGLSETSGLEPLLHLPKLKVLRLGGNKFRTTDVLVAIISKMSQLKVFDIALNPLVDGIPNDDQHPFGYRSVFFAAAPSLIVIDGRDTSGREVKDGNDEKLAGVHIEDDEEEDEEEENQDENENAGEVMTNGKDVGDAEEEDDEDGTLKAIYKDDLRTDEEDFNPSDVDDEELDEDDDDDYVEDDGEDEDDDGEDEEEEAAAAVAGVNGAQANGGDGARVDAEAPLNKRIEIEGDANGSAFSPKRQKLD